MKPVANVEILALSLRPGPLCSRSSRRSTATLRNPRWKPDPWSLKGFFSPRTLT